MKAKDYKAIAAWGKMMCSFPYYIKAQQTEALNDNAPINAIYKGEDRWETTNDITDPEMKCFIESLISKMR